LAQEAKLCCLFTSFLVQAIFEKYLTTCYRYIFL
jgi:hypothetical protein